MGQYLAADGEQALGNIFVNGGRLADPALRGIPVVVMSATREATVAEQCSGYVTFMRKPFRLPELLDVAGRVLGGGDGLTPLNSPRRVVRAKLT